MDFTKLDGMNSKEYNNLMIVDGLNLAFRYKHANKKVYSSEYLNTIQSLANSYKAKDIIILGDSGSDYRYNIYPEYKANRKELIEKQTEEEAKDFKEFLEEFNRTFELLGDIFTTFRFKGVEADDIAAYIATNYKNKYSHIWLISSDKDWDLLVSDKISRFSYVTRKEVTLNNWSESYDYPQDAHISIKVLTGDKGDHVPGVEGIGPVRAKDLIMEYGTAYDIFASIPIKSNYKYIQNLNNFGEQILINYELMDLVTYCYDAIGAENAKEIQSVMDEL